MNTPYSDNGLSGPEPGLSAGATPIEISAEASARIEDTLAALVDDVQLDFAAVLDESGAVLGWAAAPDADAESAGGASSNATMVEVMVDCSGALAMGAFAASQTLAAQLGGEASREMIHHAGSKSFHLTEISPGVALFSVWSGAVALGYLRDSAAQAVKILLGEIVDLMAAASPTRKAERQSSGSPLIDFPSSPTTAPGRSAGHFPMASRSGMARQEDDRYVFEIG
jgi:hypothetical protein